MDNMQTFIEEIITLCKDTLERVSNQTPNKFVVGVILREFTEILDYYKANKKILLLSNKVWTLWSIRTIIDSANYGYDEKLFGKVRAFQERCLQLSKEDVVYRYLQ